MKRVFVLLLCLCMVFTIVPAGKAVNTGDVKLSYANTETFFSTVEEALAAAQGGTVTLQQDMTAGQVIVPKNVTLDLNGFTLTAGVVIVMEGQLTDSQNGTARLAVSKDMLAVTGDNGGVLPVWDPDRNCYVFTKPTYQQLMNVAEDLSYANYIFVPYMDAVTTALLADGGADNGISVKVLLTWNGGNSQQFYTFSDELAAQVYGGNYALVFQLTVTGFAGIEDMTACAVVESAAGGKAANVESNVALPKEPVETQPVVTEPAVTEPEEDNVLTVEEAIALVAGMAHNTFTAEKYYVTGRITEVYNTTYGNMRLADEDGNILTVYGTYSADGKTRYDKMTVKPVAGDTVTVYGVIGMYRGTPEMKEGWITEHIPPQPEETAPAETEPVQPLPETVVEATCDCSDRFADTDEDGTCDACLAHIHYYTVIVTKPTCNQEGYTTYTCRCDHSYVADEVAATGKHSDSNKDKLCDWCKISVIVELDFYSINDLHGAFMDTSDHPGVDEFTTYMKQKYADESSCEILLSAGDMWQGSVESSSNKGALMTDWMNELGFVSMTIGNHEYDWGSSYITANMKNAEFPLLGINIRENGVSPDYCQPSTTVERGGVKIGIIGAMGDYVSSISGEFNQNLTFLTGSTLTNLVKNESARLRQQEGCDLIVYTIHGTSSDYDESLSNGYVDLVFEGHSHKSYINTDSYGVVHIQSGGYNQAVSFVNIAYNIAEDTYAVEEKKNLSNSVYGASSIADDPFIAQIYKVYFPGDDPYTTVLGRNASTRTESAICQQIAKQYLAFGEEYWSEYDIVLAGGYLNTRTPYKLYAGNVTYAQLFSLLPFDNSLVLGRISGSKLKQKFINSSSYTTVNGSAMPSSISDSKTYYIIVDTYTAYYASNGITVVDRYDDYYARDILADFIKSGGWS